MKFKVESGKIKECVQDIQGNWITPNKGWLVADKNLNCLNGCSIVSEDS